MLLLLRVGMFSQTNPIEKNTSADTSVKSCRSGAKNPPTSIDGSIVKGKAEPSV